MIVITGASDGLGKELAKLYSEADETVVNISRRECEYASMNVACDLGDADEIQRAFIEIESAHSSIDILIQCAGYADGKSLEDSSIAAIERSFSINAIAPIAVTKYALKLMKKSQNPHVVMINSTGGLRTKKDRVAYSGSKWGLTGATKVLTEELRDTGITVTGIYPGALERAMKSGEPREGGIQYGRIKEAIDFIVSKQFVGNITSIEIE